MVSSEVDRVFGEVVNGFPVFLGVSYKFNKESYIKYYKYFENMSFESLKDKEQILIKRFSNKRITGQIRDSAAEYLTAVLIVMKERRLEAERRKR